MPNEKITVITEQNMVVCLTGIQKDVQYVKEKLDASVDDHETRIRCLEQKEEDCRQTETFQGIQTTLNDHEIRINDPLAYRSCMGLLEDWCHCSQSGTRYLVEC